jgi:hypothetical protein
MVVTYLTFGSKSATTSNFSKRKQDVVLKVESELHSFRNSNATLQSSLFSMQADALELQAERDSLLVSIHHLKAELDSAYMRVESLTIDPEQRIERANASDVSASVVINQLKSLLKKAEKTAVRLEALAAEKQNLSEGKEMIIREKERALKEREAKVRQREKDLKTEALELSRRGIALNVKEDKIAALLHNDSSDSEQELDIAEIMDFEQMPVLDVCEGVTNTDALSRLNTASFPRSCVVNIEKGRDGKEAP